VKIYPRKQAHRATLTQEGYICPKPQKERCGFFLWKETADYRARSQQLNNYRNQQPQAPAPGGSKSPDTQGTAKDSTSAPSGLGPQVNPPTVSFLEDPFIDAQTPATDKRLRKRRGSDDAQYEMDSDDERAFESLAPEPPGKSDSHNSFTTPISARSKRKFSTMAAEGLPTPATGPHSTVNCGSEMNNFLNMITPDSTPTPLRFREVTVESKSQETLAVAVIQLLQAERVGISESSKVKLKDLLNQYSRKMAGVSRS
jgi:hypothetical protein